MPSLSPRPASGLVLPRAGLLAWWGTAWLRGHTSADETIDAVPGVGVLELLGTARLSGATSLGLALPAEGDPLGLAGPQAFNRAALEHGQAVVSDAGTGWVPVGQGWEQHAASRRWVPDVGEADRLLRHELLHAANALADLDVARWRPEAADAVLNLRRSAELPAPPGVPARCVELAGRGLQVEGVVELAMTDDGNALDEAQVQARREPLVSLERAARRAVVAACSPEAWPES